jgi:hypothetical protein
LLVYSPKQEEGEEGEKEEDEPEEVVLRVQGFLVESQLPPILHQSR